MNLLEEINKIIPNEIKSQIKELHAKFSDQPVTPVVSAPVAPALTLAAIEKPLSDGTIMSVDKWEVGGTASIVTPESGMQPAPDGEYETAEGDKVVVKSGLIESITPKAVDAPPAIDAMPGMPEMMAAMSNRLSAIEAKFSTQEIELNKTKESLNEANKALKISLSAINSIASVSAGEPIEKPRTILNKKFSGVAALGDSKK